MKPLIFIHGAMSDSRVWQSVVDRLGSGRTVHTIDLAGHGSRRHEHGPFTLDRFAEDTAGFARSLPGTARPIIVGWSLGASVALKVGAMGDVLAGAVLVGATPQLVADARFPFGQPPAASRARDHGLATSYAATARLFARAIARGHRETETIIAACALDTDPQVAIGVFRDASRASLLPLLPDVMVPLRLIHGAGDDIVSPRAAEYIAEHASHAAPAVIIPEAGHAPFLSHPDAFLAALVSALEAIDDSPDRQMATGNGEMHR
jgi:pimeloyl-[acyl-carrier protein] methyl ester esterase